MSRITTTVAIFLLATAAYGQAKEDAGDGKQLNKQTMELKDYLPEIHGTIRGKYEFQTETNESRFEVRNARFSVSGNVHPIVAYKAEIDLSDEGSIKMLDAYTRVFPVKNLNFTLGQMRVPFTIDAHRSPHQQYFANRSFIAKQVGNVRDVGFTGCYTQKEGFPFILEGGLFNGSGLTNQKEWHKTLNYSIKAQLLPNKNWNLTLSTQMIKPEHTRINMYDAGIYYQNRNFHVEAEYLYKMYGHEAFKDVHAVNSLSDGIFIAGIIKTKISECYFWKVKRFVFTLLALNFKASIMGKSKRKVAHSKKEEEQAQRVVKIVFVSLIILALIMLIAYSFFG